MLGFEEFGSAAATPIVFLHGGGLSGWMWRPQVVALGEFRSVVIDLPGHGRSVASPWTSVTAAADDVADLVRARSPNRPAHIVGLSLGAVVGYQLVADHPEVVASLVLSGGAGVGIGGAGLLRPLLRATLPLARVKPLVAASLAILRVPPEDRPAAMADILRLSPATLQTVVESVFTYQLSAALAARPHRLLALAGTFEHSAIHRTLRRLRAVMPNARTALVPLGLHTWNWQYPTLFTDTIRAWITEAPLPGRLRVATR